MIGRRAVSGIAASAALLIGIAVHEGYRGEAYVPVPGDVPTIGFGDTHGVSLGDTTDPVRALIRLGEHVDRIQREMRACLGDVPLHQHEWDAYVSLAYNIGTGAWCGSTLVKKLKQDPPDYDGACAEIRRWVYAHGRVLPGLVQRREVEYRMCMGLSDGAAR